MSDQNLTKEELKEINELSTVKQITQHLTEYSQLKAKHAVLGATDKVGDGLFSSINAIVLVVLTANMYMFLNIFLGLALSKWLQSYFIGFLVLLAIHLVIIIFYILFIRPMIREKVKNVVRKAVYENLNK